MFHFPKEMVNKTAVPSHETIFLLNGHYCTRVLEEKALSHFQLPESESE
jgi:hypothetical protein